MTFHFDPKEHVYTLDGEPLNGTTTVIKNVMPPFLAKWGAVCATDFIANKIEDIAHWFSEGEGGGEKFAKLLKDAQMAWSKVRKEKASDGTEMHTKLERYVKTCIENNKGVPFLMDEEFKDSVNYEFSVWAIENVKRFLYSEANVYSKELWLGGQLDLVYEKKDGTYVIGDFKSAEKAYWNMFLQCAMYDEQQKENGFYTSNGEKIGEPLDIQGYVIFAFGKGLTVHEYQHNPRMAEGVRAVVTINNLMPK